jgi:hypothetical protein
MAEGHGCLYEGTTDTTGWSDLPEFNGFDQFAVIKGVGMVRVSSAPPAAKPVLVFLDRGETGELQVWSDGQAAIYDLRRRGKAAETNSGWEVGFWGDAEAIYSEICRNGLSADRACANP